MTTQKDAPIARSPRIGHVPALDGVRGVAILLVLTHTFGVLETAAMPAHAIELLLDIGWIGVQLFFVLSGFLITGILLDTQDAPNYFSSFFGRRVLRIFPLYFGTLAVTFGLVALHPDPDPSWRAEASRQIWLWTFLENWVEPSGSGSHYFSHFWSLAVEEQFYLLWPFVLWRRSPRTVLRLCLGLMAASLAIRIGLVAQGANPEALYMYTVCRMDALAAGGAMAAALRLPGLAAAMRARLPLLLGAALVALLIGAIPCRAYHRTLPLTQTLGYSLFAVGFALLVFAAAAGMTRFGGWLRLFRWRPLMSVGRYSFAMYVFGRLMHATWGIPLLARVAPQASQSVLQSLTYVAVALLITYLLALASWHLMEKRFLRLKRHFSARSAAVTAI